MKKTTVRVIGILLTLVLTFTVHSNTNALTTSSAPTGYTLIFQDDFNTLDPVWHRGHWWTRDGNLSTTKTNEQQAYAPGNVTVGNGSLNITAQIQTVTTTGGVTYNYTSGLVETGGDQYNYPNKFTFQYGYMEARIKIPSGQGVWPAFWLWPANYQDPPEIDVMEIIGSLPQETNMTFHFPGGEWQSIYNGPDFSQDFHVYGCEWTPDYIAWFLDGVELARYTDSTHVPQQPMYLILNLAVGGDWPGPVSDSVLPATMQVDWVRVYQKSAASPTATSAPATNTPTQIPPTATPVSPTNTPTKTPTVVPPTPTAQTTTYDDKSSALVYSSGWQDVSNSKAYNAAFKRTNVTNASATLTFTGQTFSVLYTSGTGYGSINVYVDGILVGTINERTNNSRYQQRWDYTGKLSQGSHTLKLVFAGTSKFNGSLDAVIVK